MTAGPTRTTPIGSAGNGVRSDSSAGTGVPNPSHASYWSGRRIAGIRSWALKPNVNSKSLTHFQSTASTQGLLWADQIQGGTATWTVTVRGYFDGDSTDSSEYFVLAGIVKFDLVFNKNATAGYYACYGKVLDFAPDQQVDGEPLSFSATIEGHGALPAVTYV